MSIYDRTWHINFNATPEVARLLAIALKAERIKKVDLYGYVRSGLIKVRSGSLISAKSIEIVSNDAVETWSIPTGWAVGVTEIPVVYETTSFTWAGGDRTEVFRHKESGILTIPETYTGEIDFNFVDTLSSTSEGIHGKKSFMGG